MRPLLLLLPVCLLAEWEQRSALGLEALGVTSEGNEQSRIALDLESNGEYHHRGWRAVGDVKARSGPYSYGYIREAYLQVEHPAYTLFGGKRILFRGVLEAYNPVNLLSFAIPKVGLEQEDRDGAWMAGGDYYGGSWTLSGYVRLVESPTALPPDDDPDFPFGEWIGIDEPLYEEGRWRKSTYLGIRGTAGAVDYHGALFEGYDNRRLWEVNDQGRMRERAWTVTKLMASATWAGDDLLYKLESTWSHIHHPDQNGLEDYGETGIGGEYTLYGVTGDGDLGILAEYYHRFGESPETLQIPQGMDNDLFLAGRYLFNDIGDSQLLAGVIQDIETTDRTTLIEVSTRLADGWNIEVTWQQILREETTYNRGRLLLARFF